MNIWEFAWKNKINITIGGFKVPKIGRKGDRVIMEELVKEGGIVRSWNG